MRISIPSTTNHNLMSLTKEVLDQFPGDRPLCHISESDNRRSNLTKAELFRCCRECVVRVDRATLNLSKDLTMRQLLRRHCFINPPLLTSIKHRLIKHMVVAQERVGAAQACVMLQDVVSVQVVEREEGGIWLGVCDNSLLPHEFCERAIEIQAAIEAGDGVGFSDITAIAGEKSMI